jgi:hypothetical protein
LALNTQLWCCWLYLLLIELRVLKTMLPWYSCLDGDSSEWFNLQYVRKDENKLSFK